MNDNVLVPINDLKEKIISALKVCNTSTQNAVSVAEALVNAEIDGKLGHGISRVKSYSAQAQSGKVNGHARPKLKKTKPSSLAIDACYGFAYPAFDALMEIQPTISKSQGVSIAAIFNSHHFGVAGHHVEKAAEAGQISILFGNTPSAIAPWNGNSPLFGTNPIAFGAPMPDGRHVVVDMAVSRVARGKILKASQLGEKIPLGWALDKDGNPTDDPNEALKGTMVPFGDEKGSALALMIELLAAALTGANFAFESESFFTAEGKPPGVGQLMIMIDPGCIQGFSNVVNRMSNLIKLIKDQPGTHIPGSGRFELRKKAKAYGVSVNKQNLEEIVALYSVN